MRIEELSIGDWVQDRKGTVAQIIGIEAWSDGYELNIRLNGIDVGLAPALGCYPIPLTPEILEKNGIIKTYEDDGYAVYKGEGFNVTDYYTELWEFSARRNRIMLKNVHELQHARRLAGIEKEIEV